MAERRKYCFVAMPFRPELNYFFLYLKRHLEESYRLQVERGDASVLTRPLMDKVREQILRADLVIADVTGGNPNVFYEIGLAHAARKPVLFLTQDPPEAAPVDIRQFEFIGYDLSKHAEFLSRLENAITGAFGQQYETLLDRARQFLRRFNQDTGLACPEAAPEEFQARVMRGEQTGGIPASDQEGLLAQFLLPKIILDFTDSTVIGRYTHWIGATFP
jgi:hypothetical protein